MLLARERERNVKCCSCESFAERAIKILLLIDRGAGTMWHNYSDITDQMGWHYEGKSAKESCLRIGQGTRTSPE